MKTHILAYFMKCMYTQKYVQNVARTWKISFYRSCLIGKFLNFTEVFKTLLVIASFLSPRASLSHNPYENRQKCLYQLNIFEIFITNNKNSHIRCSIKKSFLKNFANFREKQLDWSFFLIKKLSSI